MPYLLLYGFLLVVGLLTSNQRQAQKTAFIFVSALLFVFVAFRYQVGCDWRSYTQMFISNQYLDVDAAISTREPAFWLGIWLFHQLGLSYLELNAALALVFFVGLVGLARRQPNPLAFMILSFPLLIINMPMSALRQAAAIGLVCLAIVAFNDRKLVRFVAYVFAASLFHNSSLVFLGLAPFVKYKLNRSSGAVSAMLVLPGAYFLLFDVADFYADRYVGVGRDAAGAIYRTGILAASAAFFFFYLRAPYQKRFPYDYQIALIGSWLMLLPLPMTALSTVIGDRFGYYLMPIQIMILARVGHLVSGRLGATISAAPFVALGVILVVWTSLSDLFTKCYMPYQSWLFSDFGTF